MQTESSGEKSQQQFFSYKNISAFRVGSQNINSPYWVQYTLIDVISENF